jgi:hypothetical protein
MIKKVNIGDDIHYLDDEVADYIKGLESHIKLHAGDCCSLSNESDMFRKRAEDAETELARVLNAMDISDSSKM